MGGEGSFKKGECENLERKSIIRNYEKLLICQKYEKYQFFHNFHTISAYLHVIESTNCRTFL